MAAVSFVLGDLATLANETKRKHLDIRLAIEKAQAEAKTVSPSTPVTSTTTLQNTFCTPFLLSLASGNAKLVSAALPPLIRLASSLSLSAQQVSHILVKLQAEVAGQPTETHLKVLQILPALMQNYMLEKSDFLRLLAICSKLANSPQPAVSNTASATLQLVFLSLFDKLRTQNGDSTTPSHTVAVTLDPGSEQAQTVELTDLELTCYHVLLDLSSLVYGSPLEFIDTGDIQLHPQSVLEIIENILSLSRDVIGSHPELCALLRLKTVPALLKVLNLPQHLFPMIVRTLRIVHLLVATQLSNLVIETEILLSFTNHIVLNASMSNDPAQDLFSKSTASSAAPSHPPLWENVLVLEMYRALLGNFSTVKNIYEAYDNDSRKKNVLQELFMVLNNFLSNDMSQLFSSEILHDTAPSQSVIMSKQNSVVKVPYLDHLDKHDAPTNVPPLYTAHLVFKMLLNFADGYSDFVANLSNDAEDESLESEVEFVTSLNDAIFPDLFQLFKKFINCHMDLEYFHMSIRALQKYTHTVGLLGLSSSRDGLLLMLSEYIIQPPNPEAPPKKNSTSHNLLFLGESIVETISSTIQQPATANSPSLALISQFSNSARTDVPSKPGSRAFNSKQVICLRALFNLAISLGSTLQSSWGIIWITYQWVEYFLHGPDKLSGHRDINRHGDPKLTAQDMSNIESSKTKFLENISEYPQSSFSDIVAVLIESFKREEDQKKEKLLIPLAICPFNRSFFVEQLIIVASLKPMYFVQNDSELWDEVVAFFIDSASDRSAPYAARMYLVERFADFVVNITIQGLKTEAVSSDALADKCLNSLVAFLDRLFSLGRPNEHLILNCETEMHLTILSRLHSLIDEHDKYFQDSWDTVFKILNTVFINTDKVSVQDNNLADKIVQLISTSYDTLKLILDEFMTTLPFNQLKSLIDTLLNFCSQTYDLNISFSSVSYFWLISDCVRSNIDTSQEVAANNLSTIDSIELLEYMLSSSPSGSTSLYQALNIYLLSKLSDLSADSRNEVREGAIQTLFQILDVQGKQMQSWEMIFKFVLPGLFDLEPLRQIEDNESRQASINSLKLILSGLVSVYSKFMLHFSPEVDELTLRFWKGLLSYLKSMLALHWKEVNSKIFQSFQDILLSIQKLTNVPGSITRLLFDFWVNVPIEYDFVNPGYQDSLAAYSESFQQLYPVVKSGFTYEDANKVISNLSKCARYPVLSPNQSDDTKLTALQKTVIANLKLIDERGTGDDILASVILLLSAISAYPYATKQKIEAKLKSKFEGRLKIPTFKALSQAAFDLLSAKLDNLTNFKVLLVDNGFGRVVSSLLFLVQHKASGISHEGEEPLWVRCNETILHLTTRVLSENLQDIKSNGEVWKLVVECITVNFNSDDSYNVRHYEQLTDQVLPVLFALEEEQAELIAKLIHDVYQQSFLYEMNEIEKELVKTSTGADRDLRAVYDAFTQFDFSQSFGTTAMIKAYENHAIRLKCLTELFRFASASGSSATLAKKYLVARVAFTLRRFIADERLLYKKPLSIIQERELAIVFPGLVGVQESGRREEELQGLYRLVALCVPYCDRIDRSPGQVQSVLRRGFEV